MAVENINHEKNALQQRIQYLETINSFFAAIFQNLDIQSVLETAVDQIQKILNVSAIEVYLYEKESDMLFLKAHRGFSPHLIGTGTLQIGEGLSGYVAEKEQPVFINNLSEDENANQELCSEEGFSQYGGVPLFNSQKKIMGVIGIYCLPDYSFTQEYQKISLAMGEIIGTAIQNSQLYQHASIRANRLVTISRAIAVTRQLSNLNHMLLDITKVLVQSLGFEQSWIGILEENNTFLNGKAGFGIGMNDEMINTQTTIDEKTKNPAVMSVVQKKSIVFNLMEDVEDILFKEWINKLNIQSFAYVPILLNEKILGVIGVFLMSNQSIEEEDIKTLTSVAEQTAIAIENSRLYEEIKTSENRYKNLFESTGTSMVIIDKNLYFRLANQAFVELSGYTQDELIGKMEFTQFLKTQKLERDDVINKIHSSPHNWETQFFDKNGATKQVHVITTQILESSDILVSLIDITHQRELERQLFQSEELAAIGELSAGIAHEIRNPLLAITNSVGLLMDESQITDEGKQLLEVVKEESNHLAAIVDDFLQFARPKKPTFQNEDINQLIKDVIKRYKNSNQKRIQWIEEYDETISKIQADRHQIQQIITNLILNSLEAIDQEGSVTIKTFQSDGNRIKISITDSGIGIVEEEKSKIFQPFYSTKETGTGMGLAICRSIINNHKGEISVDSELGMGTTFTITIPSNQNE